VGTENITRTYNEIPSMFITTIEYQFKLIETNTPVTKIEVKCFLQSGESPFPIFITAVSMKHELQQKNPP
jgi:hypothetical protein